MTIPRFLAVCFGLILFVSTSFLEQRIILYADEAVLVVPVKIPAFDEIENGIRETLQGKVDLRVVLASDYRGKPGGVVQAAITSQPVVVLPVGTTLSRAFLAAEVQNMPPIVCVAVTNPADVLGDDLQPPRQVNATVITDGPLTIYSGTSDLIKSLFPNAQRIGTVYNPGEANSISNRDHIRREAESYRWTLIEKTVNEPEDVESVARALLAENVDAIWISKDRIMTSQPERLIEIAHDASIPVFATDAGTVEGFAALGTKSVSFDELGRYVGQIILRVRNGEDPQNMPVSTVEDTKVFLSRPAISKLELEVPEELAAAAVFYGEEAKATPNADPSAVPYIVLGVGLMVVIGCLIFLMRRRTAS